MSFFSLSWDNPKWQFGLSHEKLDFGRKYGFYRASCRKNSRIKNMEFAPPCIVCNCGKPVSVAKGVMAIPAEYV
ncbi:hypothetical protein [uncultured Treponema sp.]|uniref:hypothetical protein n=1 Tax=uncultured Treponema sp. TaxID=162155 RepID=UPI0025FF2F54|nr:hypothetical protein [uncultured Treponema sp.]